MPTMTSVQTQDVASQQAEIAILSESLSHLREQIDAWLAVLSDAEMPTDQLLAIDAHLAWLRGVSEAKHGRLAWLRQQEVGDDTTHTP